MSAVRTLIILGIAAGGTLWYQNHTYTSELNELEEQKKTQTSRLAMNRDKLQNFTEEITALEKKWDYTQSLKTAGEEVFALQEEADKLRTEWRAKRDAFRQKLSVARIQAQGMKVASIRLKSGQELKNCTLGSLNDAQDTISISHDDGIVRVAGPDLTGPVADYLRMGWTLNLPAELDAPEVLADLQVEVKDISKDPSEAGLPPPPPIDRYTVTELKERRAKAISRAFALNGQLDAAKKTAQRKKEAIARIEGRYEASRMFGQDKQKSLKSQISEANKELFDFQMRIRRAEWEKLALKRDVAIIDKKLKDIETRAIRAAELEKAAKEKPPAPKPAAPPGGPLK